MWRNDTDTGNANVDKNKASQPQSQVTFGRRHMMFDKGLQRVQTMAARSFEQVNEALSSSGPNNRKAMLVLLVVMALVVLVMLVAFIVYRVQRGDLQGVLVVSHPVNLINLSSPMTIDKSKLPPTLNGQEYSYSFWLYLIDYEPTSSHKMLFMRGLGVGASSPIVFMDQSANMLYFAARTTRSLAVSSLAGVLDPSNMYALATVQYVPLQRWVQIIVSVKDGAMTLFVDGQLYTVTSVADALSAATASAAEDGRTAPAQSPRPLFNGTSGDITVGAISGTSPCRAFLSRLQVFNYAMTSTDAEHDYDNGPASATIMGALGLPEYGVRSPMYRIDQA